MITLLHIFSSFGIGGQSVRFATVANQLGRRYRHMIVAMDGDFSCADRLTADVDAEMIPLSVHKGRGLSSRNLLAFYQLLRERHPDVLVTYNWGAIEWALVHRLRPMCRHVHFEDGFGPDEAGGTQVPRRVWTRRMALRGRTRTIVPSRSLERIALGVWRLPPNQVRYVPNGIDCARFRPDVTRDPVLAGLGRDRSPLLVGTVGSLRPEKNYARLLRVIAQMPTALDVVAVFVGDGPERSTLEHLAQTLGITSRVRFLGNHSKPEHLLPWFDLYALPSDTEQMPISVLEAMAAGLPVVGTDVGDVRDMLTPANGPLLVSPNNEGAFAERLVALADNVSARKRIGQENRVRVVELYSLKRMIAHHDDLYTGLLERPPKGERG